MTLSYFLKPSQHAIYNFSQSGRTLYQNQPRFPFEYYIDIKLNDVGTAKSFISDFFINNTLQQIPPLVKSIDMPSFKIETTPLNQYNRKRLSQTKIAYEPIRAIFHDVADGKTLRFWEMYYRYYFADGSEPGKNTTKLIEQTSSSYSTESFLQNSTPAFNSNIPNLSNSTRSSFLNTTGVRSPNNTHGNKSELNNIISDTLDNHHFGFSLPTVNNVRSLISQINIYQVHGGKFNQVTLVNPRISAFTHSVLDYAVGDKTLELTFTFEYEYAYYTIQNMHLGNGANEPQNSSSIEPFMHGNVLELPSLAFNASLGLRTPNQPIVPLVNPNIIRNGKNVQSSINALSSTFASTSVTRVSTSSLAGLAHISPPQYSNIPVPAISTRPFKSAATLTSTLYKDMNRTGGNPGG